MYVPTICDVIHKQVKHLGKVIANNIRVNLLCGIVGHLNIKTYLLTQVFDCASIVLHNWGLRL